MISVILASALLVSAFCFHVNAADNESLEKRRLGLLLSYYNNLYENPELGKAKIYDNYDLWQSVWAAKDVYEKEGSTDTAYRLAYETLLEEQYNMNIYTDYAAETLELAEKEQNDKGWYSQEDWNEFQDKIVDLKNALADYHDIYDEYYVDSESGEIRTKPAFFYNPSRKKAITNAFHALLKSYNTMTNKNAVRGDVDGNGIVTVNDATVIQRYVAGLTDLNGAQKMRACVSGDNESGNYTNITVSDATQLQRAASGLISEADLRKQVIFISDIDSYESEDYLMSHVINFCICPGGYLGPSIENGYYANVDFQSFYRSCEEAGIEP